MPTGDKDTARRLGETASIALGEKGDTRTSLSTRDPDAGRRIGRYEIVERVGAGAAGVVYMARDPTIGRLIALKTIPADPVDAAAGASGSEYANERRFRREAKAAGALLHAHIVTLYDAGRDGALYYLAMEFIAGKTFAEELRQSGGRVAVARALTVGVAVAEALDFAHARGVVHRDIKPSNLLIMRDGTVKVTDFGIAQLTMANAVGSESTFIGTPNYVSPEQLRTTEVDGRSDLFSLGVVLYEALTGQHPFRQGSIAATLNAIVTAQPAPLSDRCPEIPASVAAVIMRALERDPARRFQQARELAEALRRAAGGSGDTGLGSPIRQESRTPPQRSYGEVFHAAALAVDRTDQWLPLVEICQSDQSGILLLRGERRQNLELFMWRVSQYLVGECGRHHSFHVIRLRDEHYTVPRSAHAWEHQLRIALGGETGTAEDLLREAARRSPVFLFFCRRPIARFDLTEQELTALEDFLAGPLPEIIIRAACSNPVRMLLATHHERGDEGLENRIDEALRRGCRHLAYRRLPPLRPVEWDHVEAFLDSRDPRPPRLVYEGVRQAYARLSEQDHSYQDLVNMLEEHLE